MKALATILIWLALLASLDAQSAPALHSRKSKKPLLAVSIAVPKDISHSDPKAGSRIIAQSTADPHLNVVIRNVSDQVLLFDGEDNSNGYNTLRLELLQIDGKTLPKPIIVERKVTAWLRNRIHNLALEPGEGMVREIHFIKDENSGGIPYMNFPPMGVGDIRKVRMRAVYEVEKTSDTPAKFWTGRAVSKAYDYEFHKYSP